MTASSIRSYSNNTPKPMDDPPASSPMLNMLTTPVGAVTVSAVGTSSFTVRNTQHLGGLILLNGSVLLWDTPQFGIQANEGPFTGVGVTSEAESVGSVFDTWTEAPFKLFEFAHPVPEILVVGTGATMHLMPVHLRKYLNGLGMQIEIMSTRHAASTYNLLTQEGRKVAAALLPVVPTSARTGLPIVSVQTGKKPT
ncbi:NADH dehydrogenase 1 alpha subcomplex assembly factor 3 [Chytriomyces cf. hyalinus JEL632]|nr:NADH dehydrogenase 1 alpha subcomplex assembly factor 3 [Chytriomyces cf. hyalinus JEL632]